MATMADVAKQAGVSLSTVSYVLSGERPISEATRERVLRAMGSGTSAPASKSLFIVSHSCSSHIVYCTL